MPVVDVTPKREWIHAPFPWKNTAFSPRVRKDELGQYHGVVIVVDPKGSRYMPAAYRGRDPVRALRAAQSRIQGILSGGVAA